MPSGYPTERNGISMKKIISALITLSLVLGLALTLTACGEPRDGGAEISVYLGEEVYDFDPTDYYVDSNAAQVMSLLYEPLFTLNEKGEIETDGAAKKYNVDEERRKINIELRETYWSDGKPVKAEDFVFAWRSVLLEPNNANPAAVLLYDIENAVKIKSGECSTSDLAASAPETNILEITYREGADYKQLLKNLAAVETAPLRNNVVENAPGYWSKLTRTVVTNGPFMISNIDRENNSFTIIRNEGYHQDPNVKDPTKIVNPGKLISFTSINRGATTLSYADIESKTVFYMGNATLAERAAYKDKAEVSDLLSTYTYVFNTEKELFKQKEVRQALSLAIDRNAIINAISFGKAATGFLPDTVKSHNGKDFGEELISASANIAKAKELISSVTLPEDKNIVITVNADEESIAIANIVKAAWESLDCGLVVTVSPLGFKETAVPSQEKTAEKESTETTEGEESTETTEDDKETFRDSEIQTLVKKASRGNRAFDVIGIDWNMYSSDPFVALAAFSTNYSGCGVNLPEAKINYGSFGGYADAGYDALIKSAYETADQAARDDILKNAEAALIDSACVAPLVFNQGFAFVSKDISKLGINGFGYFVLTDLKQRNYRKYIAE